MKTKNKSVCLRSVLEGGAKALEAIPVNPSSPYWTYRQKQVNILRDFPTPEAYDAMVEQGARKIDRLGFTKRGGDMPYKSYEYAREFARNRAREFLSSLGINRPAPKPSNQSETDAG